MHVEDRQEDADPQRAAKLRLVHLFHVGHRTVGRTDQGIGISSEFLPLVFDPFRRSERAQGYPGLGIGMAISHRIIEAHNGTIEVASEGAGCGSTFTVRLPTAAA